MNGVTKVFFYPQTIMMLVNVALSFASNDDIIVTAGLVSLGFMMVWAIAYLQRYIKNDIEKIINENSETDVRMGFDYFVKSKMKLLNVFLSSFVFVVPLFLVVYGIYQIPIVLLKLFSLTTLIFITTKVEIRMKTNTNKVLEMLD